MITLPLPPSTNRYWRVWRGRVVVSEAARKYRVNAGLLALLQGLRSRPGPVALSLRIYRPARRGDLDNRLKVTLDALQGVAYEDDGQVVELHAYLAEDAASPRVEVEVQSAV